MSSPRAVVVLWLAGRAWAWSCNDANATTQLKKRSLENADPMAVCNDGSAAAYYIKMGSSATEWLVYLGGGGQCYDEASCLGRYNGSLYPYQSCETSSEASPCFMSSKDYPEMCNKTGIFSESAEENPALASATKVYVPYCSSDAHAGDARFGEFEMRGRRIVEAVLADLAATYGLGTVGGTRLVFGGGSAGGRGAALLLDRVAELVGVDVVGFLDSPYYLDVQPFDSDDFVGFPSIMKQAYSNFNYSVPPACAAAYFQDEWKCALGQISFPFLRTAYLLVAAQFDAWQLSNAVLGYNGIASDPVFADDQLDYVLRFGTASAALFGTLPARAVVGAAAVFSRACYSHHTSESASYWTELTLDNASQATALADALGGDATSVVNHVDACAGYNCGRAC